MTKSPNVEKFAVTRSARICVHRHGWSSKPSLRPEKRESRRSFRQYCRMKIHAVLSGRIEEEEALFHQPSHMMDWDMFD